MFRLFHGLSWFSLGDLGVAAQSLRLEHNIDRKEQYLNTVDIELNVFVEAQSQYIESMIQCSATVTLLHFIRRKTNRHESKAG